MNACFPRFTSFQGGYKYSTATRQTHGHKGKNQSHINLQRYGGVCGRTAATNQHVSIGYTNMVNQQLLLYLSVSLNLNSYVSFWLQIRRLHSQNKNIPRTSASGNMMDT